MNAVPSLTYTVDAYNLSHASENKIHDDTVAGKLGFSGGLVPGVEVFAYATHPAIMHFGPAFLERGRMQCRFAKPIYDGRLAIVSATPAGEHALDITVESEDVLCASGHAACSGETSTAPPDASSYVRRQPPAQRPDADEESLAVGQVLCTAPAPLTPQRHRSYLADVREQAALYEDAGVAHPGVLLRLCNAALVENVVLAPWIHTGSDMQFFRSAHIGDVLSARTRVAANFERKGHRFVELDCVLLAGEAEVIAHVTHTAIYRLRHLSA